MSSISITIYQATMDRFLLPNARPRAFWRAESKLKLLLQPGGSGGIFDIQEELEVCWAALKADPTVADPEAKMVELSEWFLDEFKSAILREIAANPVEIKS